MTLVLIFAAGGLWIALTAFTVFRLLCGDGVDAIFAFLLSLVLPICLVGAASANAGGWVECASVIRSPAGQAAFFGAFFMALFTVLLPARRSY